MSENKNVNQAPAKEKSTVIQAVKAIAVLVVICLVCCLLLALCNDLFYISDEDKFNRALSKVYPGTFTRDTSFPQEPDSKFAQNATYGSILNVYKSTDGNYILQSKGIGGFSSGTVTIYVAINAADATIVGWSVESNEGQSFIGNINATAQKTWYVGTRVDGDLSLGNNYVQGTTMSSTAVNNAINMAAYYCMNALKVGSNPEGEAKEAALALLGADFANYELAGAGNVLTAKIGDDTVSSLLSDGADTISYYFRATGDKGDVQVFVYGEDENRKIVALTDGGIVKSENVADGDAIVGKIQTNKIASYTFGSYTAYAVITGAEAAEGKTVYTVAGLKISTVPNTYVLKVTVANDNGVGKVEAIEAATNGYVPGAPAQPDADKLLTSLVGATSATIDGTYNSDKVAGATQSANLITVAVKAALADFDANVTAE